jgi:hypothetical protein
VKDYKIVSLYRGIIRKIYKPLPFHKYHMEIRFENILKDSPELYPFVNYDRSNRELFKQGSFQELAFVFPIKLYKRFKLEKKLKEDIKNLYVEKLRTLVHKNDVLDAPEPDNIDINVYVKPIMDSVSNPPLFTKKTKKTKKRLEKLFYPEFTEYPIYEQIPIAKITGFVRYWPDSKKDPRPILETLKKQGYKFSNLQMDGCSPGYRLLQSWLDEEGYNLQIPLPKPPKTPLEEQADRIIAECGNNDWARILELDGGML